MMRCGTARGSAIKVVRSTGSLEMAVRVLGDGMFVGNDQPQRYCANCGAELRVGTSSCMSCGAAIRNTDTPESGHDALDFESTPEKRLPKEVGPRPDEVGARRSPRDVYRECDLHRRFFLEAREGWFDSPNG